MKKTLLYSILTLSLVACNNDENNNPQNPSEETTTMKLKEFRGITTSKYFYHENGFVDSISTSRAGNIPTEIQTKLHYNIENKLTSMERWVDVSNETIYENDIFEYNNQNLIITRKVYDENNSLIRTTNYSYNLEGYLTYDNQTYSNGNIIDDNGIIYTYDDKKNPFFEMYPTAYIRMNQINKNNQTSVNNTTETLETINWMYNQNGYPVSFQKSPILPDDVDYAEYIYY